MNETTKSDTITITHRLKRLIGSFYQQKRIDIIITSFRAGIPGTMREKKGPCSQPGSASHYRLPVPQAMQYGRVDHQATTV